MALNEAFLRSVRRLPPRPAAAPAPAAGARWLRSVCAFTATHTRGERVPSTCLGHISVAWEPGTIVTFSCGAGHGHSPFPRDSTIIVLSFGILAWPRGSQQSCWEIEITVLWLCTFTLPFYEKGRFGSPDFVRLSKPPAGAPQGLAGLCGALAGRGRAARVCRGPPESQEAGGQPEAALDGRAPTSWALGGSLAPARHGAPSSRSWEGAVSAQSPACWALDMPLLGFLWGCPHPISGCL